MLNIINDLWFNKNTQNVFYFLYASGRADRARAYAMTFNGMVRKLCHFIMVWGVMSFFSWVLNNFYETSVFYL